MLRTGEIIRKRFDQEEDHYTRSLDPFSKNRRRGRVKKGIQIEENEEGNVCTRAPPEHLSSPPSTHSARRIRISRSIRTISQLYTRPTSAISTRSASFHLALRLSRPRSRLIELGRREMLRGNFSNRGSAQRAREANDEAKRN